MGVAFLVRAVLQSIMRLSSLFGFLFVCSLLGLGSARGLAATATEEGTGSSKVETESAPKTYNPKEELKESQETKPDTESAGEELKEEIDETYGDDNPEDPEELELELRDEEVPSTRFPFFPFPPPWAFHPMMLRQYGNYPRHRQAPHHRFVRPRPRYLQAMDSDLVEPVDLAITEKPTRSRRSAFSSYKKNKGMIEVKDSDEWWYDIDGGEENEVSEYFKRNYPGYASAAMQREMMDLYAPALHIGEIDTGYEVNPYLSKPSDRTFGQGADFNQIDLYSMHYQPTGQRFASIEQFLNYLVAAELPKGQKFFLDKYKNSKTRCFKSEESTSDEIAINIYPKGFIESPCPASGVFKLHGWQEVADDYSLFFRSTTGGRFGGYTTGERSGLYAIWGIEATGIKEHTPKRSNVKLLKEGTFVPQTATNNLVWK